jgi:Zn-finger nucleic acid-binding protein
VRLACPKCENETLREIGGPRAVATCDACGGTFVPHGSAPVGDATPPEHAPVEGTDVRGGRCPFDHSILSRAEIDLPASGKTLHLERCSSCHGIWFDAGEWNALAQEHLLDSIDDFWSIEYRTRHRHERESREAEARTRTEFGDLYEPLAEIASQLRGHPRRSQMLAFIRERSSE